MSARHHISEELGHDFLNAFYHMVTTARNYQDNNQLIRNSVRSFKSLLDKIMTGGETSLLLWRSRFYLGGEKLPYRREASSITNSMIEYFARRGIESFNFLESSRDASPEDILIFTRLLNDAVKSKDSHSWLGEKLLEHNFSWVQVF